MSTTACLESSETFSSGMLSLALLLFDSFTGQSQTFGSLNVSIAGQNAPVQKLSQATFLFFDLPSGSYNVQVSSASQTPYYQPVTITVAMPFPSVSDPTTGQILLWPAYPDISKADRTKAPDDPTQPQAFLQQRQLAGLVPTANYPFPPGTTLIRGTVLNGTSPAASVVVACADAIAQTMTDSSGQFVLIFSSLTTTQNGTTATISQKTVTVQATFGSKNTTTSVLVQRGMSASIQLQLTP